MSHGLEPSTLLWAVGWDVLLGDIPEEADPAGLAVRAADVIQAGAPQNSLLARTAYGTAAAFALPSGAWLATKMLLGAAGHVHGAVYRETATVLLKGSLSIRGSLAALRDAEAAAGGTPPSTGDPSSDVGHEPGMQTSAPPPVEVDEASQERANARALRRLARDLRDGVIGPLVYYSLFGIPGAVAYRVIKTVGSRWRRNRDDEDPLTVAAGRVEAVATFLPSIASGLLLSAGAQITAQRGTEAWEASRNEARSKGGRVDEGWAEGALAGGLDVRIASDEDTPVDTNPAGRAPNAEDLGHARQLFWTATAGAIAVSLFIVGLRRAIRR